MDKIFPVWKPKGPTSFDIIREFQKVLSKKEKIGHAGTLDPLASGILVIAIGREATKKISEVVSKEKEYIADINLGATSTTDDAEGEILQKKSDNQPSRSKIEKILKEFIGEISQVPPIYSALKINGEPAYKLARKGKIEKMMPRKVFIKKIELLKYIWPILTVKVTTGPGVYIRSLARDVGLRLDTGAYLSGLERTRVGEFTKNKALSVEEAVAKLKNENLNI